MDCKEANRRINPLRQEFAVRFYRWAELDLRREMDEDFARVKRVKSGRALHYLEFLMDLPRSKRATAALAILRASVVHRTAREQLALNLTDGEKGLLEAFQQRFYPVALWSRAEALLKDNSAPSQFEVDRDRLQSLVTLSTAGALETKPVAGRESTFWGQIGCWHLKTGIDVYSVYQLRYGHTITARKAASPEDYCPVQLKEGGISFLGWLGVDPGTTFTLLRKSEIQPTADFIAEMVKHFAVAVPQLLDGLVHDVPEVLNTKIE